jgi:uncharacterized protein (DUF983 family)
MAQTQRKILPAMLCGALGRCPACGKGPLFARYLKVADHCGNCGEALHHHRADDAPPYFTILIAGHILVPALIAFEAAYRPALWLHVAIWAPITIMLCMALLSPIKGAIVGLQWANHMHGFGLADEDPAAPEKLENFN